MPRPAPSEQTMDIGKWTGLNTVNAKRIVSDHELTDVSNFDLGTEGELIKRTGFAQKHSGFNLGANPVHILGYFRTPTVEHFIARSGTTLYTSPDAITWTPIAGAPHGLVEFGVQYTNKFYMVRSNDTILQWDGAALTAIVGSPSGTHCVVFKDRLFVVNALASGVTSSRLFFSEPFDFSATGWPAINYVGVAEGDGDVLTTVTSIQDTLVVFKTNSMWQLFVQGDDIVSWILRLFQLNIGCISKHTAIVHERLLYFLSARGVFATDGNEVREISSQVSPAFAPIISSVSNLDKSSSFVWKDKYVLALETFPSSPTWGSWLTITWASLSGTVWGGAGAAYAYLVYHTKLHAWTLWFPNGLAPHRFVSVTLNSSLRGVYCGDRSGTGRVFKYNDSIWQDNTPTYTGFITNSLIGVAPAGPEWLSYGGSAISGDATEHAVGTGSAKIVIGVNAGQAGIQLALSGLTIGVTYTVSALIKVNGIGLSMNIYADTAANPSVAWVQSQSEGFLVKSLTFTATSAAHGVYFRNAGNSNITMWVNAVHLQIGTSSDYLNYEAMFETKEFDFGNPTELKRGKWIGLDQSSSGSELATHIVDGVSRPALPISPVGSDEITKTKGPGYFRSWRFRFSATHQNQISIFAIILHLLAGESGHRQVRKNR